ncbi:MAG: carbohydrate binding family 9 domain-containing protein [Flavobacteriaceae bacterium]|nr:carbohydrate binding family 9 domain-containing protein [Flavobacteriaceae bacterium]
MTVRLTFLLSVILCIQLVKAQQPPKKSLNISRTDQAPKIDGVLDDEAWVNAEIATDFIQFRPEMGVTLPEHKKTIVKMTYDDNAIYVSAYLKDKPEEIQRQLTSRDNFGNSDFFLVVFNPNNDAQNDVEFFVFTSGTQADAIASPSNGEDFGWSAVWDSAVKLVDDGWIVEMKIPYRALRFSKDVKTWGLQFHRRFRIDNTQYTWNPIDRTKGNIGLYHGELTGIENIEPPTRLNFYPFASTVFNNFESPDYNIGLDLKYGVTENFTLDATLIPDFSQAAFDNVRLNLGPFEQTFGEQRQFFKEGVDLFNKGNLFFSRRVGNSPTGSVELAADEELVDYPNEVKVLNAIKLSGRTKKGLGIGVFNAITEKTEATIKNTLTDESRKEVVEPFSNYNILVVDQQFNGNSSISLINTNVTRSGSFRDGNVTGLITDISNKRNTYNIRGDIKMSNVNEDGSMKTGLSSFFFIRKAHGKFRYSFDHRFASTDYDINDLGLNFRNNFNNFGIDVNYRIFEPTEKLNNFFLGGYMNYRRLYKPSTFTGTNFGMFVNGQTKKLMWFRGNLNFEPGKQFDYFEPRDFENKRFFVYKNIVDINGGIETNSNKTLSFEVGLGTFHAFDKERDLFGYFGNIEPTVIVNDKFRVSYEFQYRTNRGSRGYANNSNNIEGEIIFGERDVLSIENSISGSYTFNPFHTLSLSFRNFWSTVTYDQHPYFLQDDGSLIEQSQTFEELGLGSSDVNFNTWNLDLSYTWQVAPGSFLTALYRNQLFNFSEESRNTYFESLGDLFDQDMNHIFSLRLQYFIDYNSIKGIFKKKNRTNINSSQNSQVGMRGSNSRFPAHQPNLGIYNSY